MHPQMKKTIEEFSFFYTGNRMELVPSLIQMIADQWEGGGICYRNGMLELTTQGFSVNEWIIKGLQRNPIFHEMFWHDSCSSGIHRYSLAREDIPEEILRHETHPIYPASLRTWSGLEILIDKEFEVVTECNTHRELVNNNPFGAFIIRKDGCDWMAHDLSFENLQESHFAFAESPMEALRMFFAELPEEERETIRSKRPEERSGFVVTAREVIYPDTQEGK